MEPAPHNTSPIRANPRLDRTIPIVLFVYQFISVVANVTLPFYVQTLAPNDPSSALRWTGWMLGVVPLMTIVTTPLWMRWAHRAPNTLYLVSQTLQAGCYFWMAVAPTLPELFVSRLVLGISGSPQSLALVIVSRSGAFNVGWTVAAVQSATTLASALGPLGAGAISYAALGLTSAFILAGLAMLMCGAIVWIWVPPAPLSLDRQHGSAGGSWVDPAVACVLVFVGFTHVYLLTGILPQVVTALGVAPTGALAVGGWILLGSGISIAIGSMIGGGLAKQLGERRTLVLSLVTGAVLLILLGFAAHPGWFGVIRALETLAIAPVMILAITRVTRSGNTQAIGLVNSSRVMAGSAAPIIATNLLIVSSILVVFTFIAVMTLIAIPLIILGWRLSEGPARKAVEA